MEVSTIAPQKHCHCLSSCSTSPSLLTFMELQFKGPNCQINVHFCAFFGGCRPCHYKNTSRNLLYYEWPILYSISDFDIPFSLREGAPTCWPLWVVRLPGVQPAAVPHQHRPAGGPSFLHGAGPLEPRREIEESDSLSWQHHHVPWWQHEWSWRTQTHETVPKVVKD